MASGYVVAGRGDLDALFMARTSAKRADVGYQVAGVDIANRYEPIGAGTPIAATGFKSGGTDLANLFRSAGEPANVVSITNVTASSTAAGFAQAGYRLAASGRLLYTTGSNNLTDNGAWITPQTNMSLYSAMATQIGGSAVSGVGVWGNLASDQTYLLPRSTLGTITGSIRVDIRRDSDSVIVSSATISLTTTRT